MGLLGLSTVLFKPSRHENTGVARLNVRYYFYFDSLLYLLGISTECNRFTGQRFALLVVRAIIGIN